MDITRTRLMKLVRIAATVVAVLLIAGYASYRSLPYLRGPQIHIFQPLNGSSIATSTVTVIGRAERVNSLSLNDNPLQVDEEGDFKQTLIVFPGVNVITLKAADQFGRFTVTELRLFGAMESL
jgi:hypothetical protein